MPLLRDLEVDATLSERCGLYHYDSPLSITYTRKILEGLFSILLTRGENLKMLRALNLKGLDLRKSDDLTKAIPFHSLERLILQQCANVSYLLSACKGPNKPQSLRDLLITSTTVIENCRKSTTRMNSFLSAATNLERLVVDAQFDPSLEPSLQSFAKSSLQVLMLRCTSPTGPSPAASRHHWAVHEVQHLAETCPHLQEIGIHFPPLSLWRSLTESDLRREEPQYCAFTVIFPQQQFIITTQVDADYRVQAAFAEVTSLLELQDFSSPYCSANSDASRANATTVSEAFVHTQSQILAESIMKMVPQIKSVTVGSGADYYWSTPTTTYHRHSYQCKNAIVTIAVEDGQCHCEVADTIELRKGEFVRWNTRKSI